MSVLTRVGVMASRWQPVSLPLVVRTSLQRGHCPQLRKVASTQNARAGSFFFFDPFIWRGSPGMSMRLASLPPLTPPGSLCVRARLHTGSLSSCLRVFRVCLWRGGGCRGSQRFHLFSGALKYVPINNEEGPCQQWDTDRVGTIWYCVTASYFLSHDGMPSYVRWCGPAVETIFL